MGWNLKDWRSYEGCVKDMVMAGEVDLIGVKRPVVVIGVPWKDDLWSKKEDLRFIDREEVRVEAMAVIEGVFDKVLLKGFWLCKRNWRKLQKIEGLREEILDDGYLTMCSKWRDVKISGKKKSSRSMMGHKIAR
jgi:hypothetical protein